MDQTNGWSEFGRRPHIDTAIERHGNMMTVLDVLARQVGILGIFSDWPAATTLYANCAGLR